MYVLLLLPVCYYSNINTYCYYYHYNIITNILILLLQQSHNNYLGNREEKERTQVD